MLIFMSGSGAPPALAAFRESDIPAEIATVQTFG